MNIYASKTGHTFYTLADSEKRNPYQIAPKRIYKNFEKNRRSTAAASGRDRNRTGIDAIITFFRGTVVTGCDGTIEWNTRKLFSVPE
ncbi:MAG: hypothetical protein A2176_05080 [Spirochaetes bacterium RBG_13_51_14]|nr:MAG: hypothetical protein A2176_05080 [Spirochaetes bacterium RBG_13_51_14]